MENTSIPELIHAHQCEGCGTLWHHSHNFAGDPLAHSCPGCGRKQWKKVVPIRKEVLPPAYTLPNLPQPSILANIDWLTIVCWLALMFGLFMLAQAWREQSQ